MLRRLVLVLALLLVPTSSAFAQCSRIGEQVCQGGYLYTCQACGSEKCLIYSGEQCQVPVDSLIGTWSGSGHQSGGDTESMDYPVVMRIVQGGGSIDYPSLSCGGSLTELSSSGTSAQYQEHITYGDCVEARSRSTWSTAGSPGPGSAQASTSSPCWSGPAASREPIRRRRPINQCARGCGQESAIKLS